MAGEESRGVRLIGESPTGPCDPVDHRLSMMRGTTRGIQEHHPTIFPVLWLSVVRTDHRSQEQGAQLGASCITPRETLYWHVLEIAADGHREALPRWG